MQNEAAWISQQCVTHHFMIWHKAGMFVLCLILQIKHCPLQTPCSQSCRTHGCWTGPKLGRFTGHWRESQCTGLFWCLGFSCSRWGVCTGFSWIILSYFECLASLAGPSHKKVFFLSFNTSVNLKGTKYSMFITSCRAEALFGTLPAGLSASQDGICHNTWGACGLQLSGEQPLYKHIHHIPELAALCKGR